MKKVLPALVLMGFLVFPVLALAQYQPEENPPEGPGEVIQTGSDLLALIKDIGDWIFAILLGIAGIFLVVAGIFFVTAGGNPEQVNKARQMLINALIGIAVAVGAKGIIALVRSILGA